jgi:LuxR family maltose regulon positive regulatory protein
MLLSESLRRSIAQEVAGVGKTAERSVPVAAAKIQIPVGISTALIRERLHALLNAAVTITPTGSPVTVVCAPAGAGKTTMVATWLRRWVECGDGYAAWVSLDAEDNDPVLLWSEILRALRASGAWDRGGPLELLTPPLGMPYAAFLATISAAFDQPRAPVVLVLDGIHEVSSTEAMRTLNLLLRHTPAMLRIVLVARFPPPLNLARLKVEGRLKDIDPNQLNFSAEEARLLYANEGIRLTKPELRLLMERTEGWPAGLRLAALTRDDAARPAAHLSSFTGDERVVADYLVEEVLARQSKDVQQFMLSTSVSQTFTAGLAAALSRQQNVGHILEYLERAGILICDRGQAQRWYRYHPLLGRCLRAELGRRRLSARHELHRIAADWFLAASDPLRAMGHAIASGDDDLVIHLVASHGLEQILKGRAGGLRNLLGTAPQRVLAKQSVSLVAAAAALDLGDLPSADRWLHRTTNRQPLRDQRLRALHATVRLHRALFQGDIEAALVKLKTTRAGQSGDRDADLLALFSRGVAASWTGDRQAAAADLQRALELAGEDHRDAVMLRCLVHLAAEGDLSQLSERAESALEFAESRGLAKTFRSAYLYTLLGVVAYQRLDDQRANQLCTLATNPADGPVDATVQLFAHTLRAMVNFDHADDPLAVAASVRRQWRQLSDRNLSPILVAYLVPACQRMALRVGDHGWAMELLQRADAILHPSGERTLLRATLHAHTGKVGLARRLLQPILHGQIRTIVTPTLVDAWVLEAHLAHRTADIQRAHQALSQAIALAAPHHIVRPFHESGQTIRGLLASGAGRFGQLEPFAAKVMAAIPAPVPDLTDGLTKREQALLAELPSMRTAEEIADSMFVSVNTVKTHLRGIYRKLGVNRRRDAITVARQRGLL